jgi:hypothetical protein
MKCQDGDEEDVDTVAHLEAWSRSKQRTYLVSPGADTRQMQFAWIVDV